jgi:heavy metal sensor kinase
MKIVIEEHIKPRHDDHPEAALSAFDLANDYYQVYNVAGIPMQHSSSMPDGTFKLEPELLVKLHDDNWYHHDYAEASGGVRVRRVTIRAPVSSIRWENLNLPGTRGRFPSRPPPLPQQPRPMAERRTPSPPEFFFQYAKETVYLDENLATYDNELKAKLAELEDASEDTLVSLRHRLLLIGLFACAATLVGGFWLVPIGLSPLQRLTTAVSQVSEKDFRLPIDDQPLPRELKPIVQRLTQTLDQLRRAFEHEKQAAADISHELRTPLSALLATTDVALRKQRTPEEYRTALEECRSSGRQMYQLVERLLALARLDAGVDRIQRKDVEVTELAEVCTALIRPLAESRGLKLEFHEAPPLAVRGDPDKLSEVLNNLLHNAIEYNRDGGSIDVRVGRDNGSVVVEVADTGIGIAPQHRDRIFERFYRADPSRQADGLHAGLGLAITKGYVELMGGSISVDSREGAGTTFRVKLPAQEG